MSGEKESLDKTRKYDRQLRLWGDHGQCALESAKVCLINATATGTEILKNLILPGVGSFTIVDGKKVTGEDVGNNFFLDKDKIGESRAQVATDLLLELNEDVTGNFMEESPELLLERNPEFFDTFTIVVAVDLPERVLHKLSGHLWEKDIPLMVVRAYGLIGSIRLVAREHTVIESHPDNAHEDLRLDRPFPGLTQYCDSLDLSTMKKKDHSHTPWLVIIFKYLQIWKEQHGGAAPKNYKEKNEFKKLIQQGVLRNEEGVPEVEENFDEAINNVNVSLVPTSIPSAVQNIFNDSECVNLQPESKPFWILARAVKDFVESVGEGALPLRGTIPDMTADSERYIQLQQVYRQQAAVEAEWVANRVQQLLQSLGKSKDTITEADVKLFCRNASFLRVLQYRSIAQEYDPATAKIGELVGNIEESDEDDAIWYILLRAVDKFYADFNRYPGVYDDQVEADIPKLKTCLAKLLHEYGNVYNIKDDFVHEMCRYGAAEIHSVASFLGGVAAQEAIKIITGQFVPMNNTYIYNAMKQTSVTVEL
ncbi:NEDD8-activating enzyme E1 regulatory subunit isoform X2 [Lingula anatina]|uniref:NEDD8-activating enzyme E1 regulatory subunit n=1 Tax=Lingula anatina TaxID=7574 RepID=A0A1S3I5G6_LINAN|nr:NEDD8-activating enzyme E1 regulatory subunit isoform X2 [Lingula anatina]|eukprot:XP_013393468.1 NEDD8-activating enzyme E1 regulatory subunit isoform X2 [Lingula anatina]